MATLKEILPPSFVPNPQVHRADETEAAIFKAYEDNASSWFSRRLGASIIGKECLRALWYSFRWAYKTTFEGRMLSLFEVGHWEEDRVARDLRNAGMTVKTHNKRGKQFTFPFLYGHAVDKIDGAVLGVKEAPKTWHLWESKTMNLKGFNKLIKNGIRKERPEHFAQIVTGMSMMKGVKKRGLYTVRCKDDSRNYIERIRWEEGCKEEWLRLYGNAEKVVFSPFPLTGISNDPTFFKCKFCDYSGVCFGEIMPLRNCRTCMHSTPVKEGKDGTWICEKDGGRRELKHKDMTKKKHCHRFIPSLLTNYEQIDVIDDVIIYRDKRTGEEWVDNGK